MEIRQLEIFRALAEELHFSRAAEQLHCVQSNVSTQIRALEEELGRPLFDRLAKRVILTDVGRRFLPYAERVLSALEEARRVVAENSTPAGTLLIGSSESMLTYRLPEVLSKFRKEYPEVQLSFRPYAQERLMHSIESGELDLAICMTDIVEHERLKSLRLRSETLLFVVAPKDPLAMKKRVKADDLGNKTFLVTEAGCAYRKKLTQLLTRINIRPANVIEFSSVEAIKECVSLGMGVALLPEIVVAEHLARKRLKVLPWGASDTNVATYIVWHRDKWVSPALHAFITVLRRTISPDESHQPAQRTPIGSPCIPVSEHLRATP
ncbi:MAG: LysR family transcriptional regulator [Candidatus Sulfotelmatobacter sp.]